MDILSTPNGVVVDPNGNAVSDTPVSTDYDALTNRPKYNGSTITSATDIPEVKTNDWDGKYSKPDSGIPDSDIASASAWNAKGTYSKPDSGIPDSDIASASVWNAKGTYSKPSGGIPDSDIASASAWNSKQGAITSTTAALLSFGWSESTQTVSVTGVTANNVVLVSPAPASTEDWSSSKIYCSAQGSGTLTFTCLGDAPANDITVNVVVIP